MSNNCKITYNSEGKITGVKDLNGNDSKLFRQIVSNPHISAEQGVEIYKQTFSDKIKIEEELIIDSAKKNNTYLKAPNGEDTNLSPEQWVQVRTKAFKNWFGDWENIYSEQFKPIILPNEWLYNETYEKVANYYVNKNNFSKGLKGLLENITEDIRLQKEDNLKNNIKPYEKGTYELSIQDMENIQKYFSKGWIKVGYRSIDNSVSQVVDENNEPKVVYHASKNKFNIFEINAERVWGNNTKSRIENGFYFTDNKLAAIEFALQKDKKTIEDKNTLSNLSIYEVFLNIKHPNSDYLEEQPYLLPNLLNRKESIKKDFNDGTIDGLISMSGYLYLKESFKGATNDDELYGVEYIVKNPNQIKSATENTGEFNPESNNIRFKVGPAENNAPIEITEQLIERLKQTGLVENVELLTNEEILQKLEEFGLTGVQKQKDLIGNTWKSTAKEGLEKITQKSATPEQWVKMIADKGGKGTAQELEWIGLEDYLNSIYIGKNKVDVNDQKAVADKYIGSIPKEVVEQYIEDNQIEIVEVNKGRPVIEIEDLDAEFDGSGFVISYSGQGNLIAPYITLDQIDLTEEDTYEEEFDYHGAQEAAKVAAMEEMLEREDGEVQHADYQLEGGENYREVLFTLPNKASNLEVTQNSEGSFDVTYKGNYIIGGYSSKESAENALTQQNTLKILEKIGYESPPAHYSERNILAHVRMNERTLPNGERVLFIEEVQSDWAQDGKKKGFTETYEKEKLSKNTSDDWRQDLRDKFHIIDYTNNGNIDQTFTILKSKYETFDEAIQYVSTKVKSEISVPNMPYKKTDQWVGMAMRRVMQMATQEGFDRIAWVTGEQSADRYDLSKSIGGIQYNKNSQGNYNLQFQNKDSDTFIGNLSQSNITESKLEDFVGKEVAKKIINEEGDLVSNEKSQVKIFNLKQDDLKVGGEGMKTFYNSILPKVAKKEAQRFDKKAKVEVIELDSNVEMDGKDVVSSGEIIGSIVKAVDREGYVVVDKRKNDMYIKKTFDEAFSDFQNTPDKQLSIPLTDKAKQNLNEAIPLFQKQDNFVKGFVFNNNIYLNTESMSLDTPIHEFSHLYNSWTKQNRPELYEKGVSLIEEELNKDNSEIQDVIDFVKKTQPDLKGEALKEEILTELIGRRGTNLLNSNKQSSIADWLREVWDSIKNALGLSQYSIEEVRRMDIGEYSNAVVVDLLRGEDNFASERTGQQNEEFFTGKAAKASSNVEYSPVIDVDQTTPVAKAYEKYSAGGNFTGHISKMIAGFQEKQKQVAEAIVKGGFTSFLDIGASEGGLAKTVASQNSKMKAVALDPNSQMKANFDSTPEVKNVTFVQQAYQGSWTEADGTEIKEYNPKQKFDVINEDFAFQFINNNRSKQVKGVKEMMTKDGIFITSEKFINTENYAANEEKKYDHQRKYFNEAELTKDKQEIVTGMAQDMVNDKEYEAILKENFKYVEEFWNAGNFKGYLASDNKSVIENFKSEVGDLTTEFTDKSLGEEDATELTNKYLTRLIEVKNSNPSFYWSLDIPSEKVVKSAAKDGRLVDTNGGMGIVEKDGNMIGMFKYDVDAKLTGKAVQEARIKLGGIKLDNYDGKLTEIYTRNGFRVTSRTPFNREFAPEEWSEELHGTPDVVAMIYDPNNLLYIEEKTFDTYEETLAYRDSFIEKAPNLKPQEPIIIEPTLSYETPYNSLFNTFSEALKNTQTGEIKAVIGDVILFTVDSSTDYNTYNGTINGLIKSGILSGESILEPTGEKVIVTEGVGDIIKVINSVIAKEALIKAIGRNNIKETIDSNFIITEAGVGSVQVRNSEGIMENIPLDTLENGVKEELKKQFPDTYMDIISMQAYRTLFKGISTQTEAPTQINFTPENELQQALISLLNKMGVKITAITDYVTKFATKNGVEPSAAALANLANLIVAFKDGVITQAELSEEVAHFIVETLPQTEIENLLRNIHRTAEWQQHADNYFKIYKEQNPNISEEELEQLVRKEILGKVLAAGFESNFNAETGSETQKNILQKLAELFNNFIEKIRARFKPQYETELENWSNKVYANLMADDLYDQLDKTQLEGKNYLMYSSSKKADDPITQINVRAQKAVNVLESNVGRLREGSSKTELNQYRADLEKLDEQSKILGVSGIVGVAKRQTAYLKKILDANKKQNHPFTQDENAVYINTVGVMLNYMTEIRSLLEPSNKNHKRIIEQVDGLIKDINTIKGDKNILQDTAWENMVEELSNKLSLTPTEKQQLLDAYLERTDKDGNKIGGQGKKDTNWFFAHIAPMVHAQDPALNMASNIISKMTMRHGINTYNRVKRLFDKWEKLGITEPNKLLKTWKKGSYLFNPIKYEILDQEILEKKIELYKKATGEELSPEEFQEAEKIDNLSFNSVVDQVNFYEDVSEFRKENHYVDYLTKEARAKRNEMYEGLSKEAVRIDKNLSRERGQVGQEADRFGSYTQEHKYRLQQINKKRQRAKNPYNGDGQLKPGLIMQGGEIVKDPRVQNIDVDAQIVLDLQELDKRKMEAFKEKNKEDKPIPQRFLDLLSVAQTEEEAIELLFLNANISFTNDFWDSLATNDSFVNKLEAKTEKTEKTTEIIERLKSLQKRRAAILKANKVHNLPSEIDFEEMEGSEIVAIKDLSEQLQAAYQEARNELGETTNEETQDPVFSSVVNEAYKEQIKNRSLEDFIEEEFEFIKEHTTKSDSLLLEKARGIAEDIIRGREPRLSDFYKSIFKEEYAGTDEEIRREVYQELVDYSKGKLLPYFKRIEPTAGQSFTQVMEMLNGGQKTALDFMAEFEAGQYPSIQVTPNYIFFDETNNDERNPEYDKNERLGLPQIQSKYRDSEFEDYFGFNYDTGQSTKNANEYQAWQALVEFHEESLEITNMKDRHNKFLLPQKGVRGARQMHKLLSGPNKLNTLKEVLKDMTSFRQDEKEYGETSNGKVLGGKEGDLRIPKYGFNKLDNQLDLTDELLESYIWMGSEAELYTARVGAFADMEAIKNLIANNTYSNKEGEKSRIYKMFDSFYRYNIYGQNEEFSYETDFFGILPKKYNLAPLAKKLQFWVRLVNLGFNLIVPLTSILQGGVNLTIERFVGERIDKDASKLARRDLPKYLTEAVGDTLALNGKSKMSSMAELLGVFEIEDRFRDSNYNKFTRGMLRTGFITHSIADAPIKAQVMLTVLKDMRIVDGDVINFNRFRQQRMFEAKEKGETVNDNQLREQWRKYEDKTFDKYMSTKDGITQIEKQKLKDDLFGNTPVNEIEFEDILDLKLQFVRDSIQRTAQEIDTMIPNEERSFAQRHAIFSFFFLHRGWMSVAYNRKFKGRHLNTHTGITEEGNWNGSAEFVKEWINEWKNPKNTKTFLKTLKSQWQGADDTRRRSMHRTMIEVLAVNSLAALSLMLMGMADDEEDSWPAQFVAYLGYRVSNEVLTSTISYPKEAFHFLESPVVGIDKIRAASDIWDLTSNDLVERGKYRGQTERMRFIYKNLPAFKEYYNVKNAGQTRQTYKFYNQDNFKWAATTYFLSQED